MKTFKLILASVIATMSLQSCDSNKAKIEESAKLFVSAVNSQDKASIYNLYPKAKKIANMRLAGNIVESDMSIEKNDSGEYVASFSNARQQKLIFSHAGGDEWTIKDSYSIFELDSATMELAIKTGVPVKKLSDCSLSELMDENGRFITYLNRNYASFISGNLVFEQDTYTWNRAFGGSVLFTQPIRNTGIVTIKGNEYNVEFTFYSISGENGAATKIVEPGVDLEPNEATSLIVSAGSGYLNACENGDFGVKKVFVYKNMTPIKSLLKYVKLSGKEYDEFLEALPRLEAAFNLRDFYLNAFQRKLTEEDLKGISKDDLRKARNTIYACHGYIFKDKELAEYFNSCNWYKGTTTDMNKISSEFNDIEKYNVDFIKEHER